MGVTLESFEAAVDAELAKLPRVTGSGREADKYYVARAVDTALNSAEDIAKQMKDEYVSVEHLFLSLIENADAVLKSLFRPYQITKEACLQALQSVRGSQRVTSDTPEDTYEALAKYGTDLVKRAREQKMGRSSDVTTRSGMLSASCPARRRTTPFSSANRASARRPSSRALRSGSSRTRFPSLCRTKRSSRSIWAH